MRAYIFGGAISSALIAAALAAFLSATSLYSNTSFPGERASAAGSPDAVAIDVGRLGPLDEAALPPAPSPASPLPLLASTALPVPVSPIETVTPAGRSAGSERRRSSAADAQASAAKRTGGSSAADDPSASAPEPDWTPPGLAKKSGGLPPGLAKKPGGLPPGLAKKDRVPSGHAR